MALNSSRNAQLEAFVCDTISIPVYFNDHLYGTKEGLTKLVESSGSASVCPFHDDVNPSFRYWQAKKFFNCFGCGVSGDVINLHRLTLQRKNHVKTTREAALQDLCRIYNIKTAAAAGTTAPTPVNMAALRQAEAAKKAEAERLAKEKELENLAPVMPTFHLENVQGTTDTQNASQNAENAPDSTKLPKEIIIPTWVLDPSESVFQRCRKQSQNFGNLLAHNREVFNMLEYKRRNDAIAEAGLSFEERFKAYAALDEEAGIEISMNEDKLQAAAKLTPADTKGLF